MFALPLALLLCSGPATIPPMLQGVHRIVVLGDSITEQGAAPRGYVTLFRETLKRDFPDQQIEVINSGISGHKSNDMLARFKRDVTDHHPDLVTINVGVNDVWHNFKDAAWQHRVPEGNSGRGLMLPAYIENVGKMIDLAKAANAKVILVSPSLVYEDLNCAENKRLSQFVRAEEKLARERGVGFINLNREFHEVVGAYQKFAGRSHLLLTIDGVHLNDQGNILYANSILKYLGAPTPENLNPQP